MVLFTRMEKAAADLFKITVELNYYYYEGAANQPPPTSQYSTPKL